MSTSRVWVISRVQNPVFTYRIEGFYLESDLDELTATFVLSTSANQESVAGQYDIEVTGNREDVLIIRQYPQGQKVHHLNKEAESKSTSSKIKLNLSLAVYECPSFNTQSLFNYTLLKKKYQPPQ